MRDAPDKYTFIRIVFRNEDAAYYQFHVFPTVDWSEGFCMSRKRSGDSQYMQVFYQDDDRLETFVKNLHHNPHVMAVHEITEEDFLSKRSESV